MMITGSDNQILLFQLKLAIEAMIITFVDYQTFSTIKTFTILLLIKKFGKISKLLLILMLVKIPEFCQANLNQVFAMRLLSSILLQKLQVDFNIIRCDAYTITFIVNIDLVKFKPIIDK